MFYFILAIEEYVVVVVFCKQMHFWQIHNTNQHIIRTLLKCMQKRALSFFVFVRNSMQTKSICYPRFIFIIVMIIVSTVILTKLLHGSTWLQKNHRNSKMDGVSVTVSNLLEKLIKLNSSLERPSQKTFQLLVTLMHLLKDESLSNKNIFNVLKKISENKNKRFRFWKEKNELYNVSNEKSVLDQLSSLDHYVNLVEHLRNFNYSQEKGSHGTHISNTTEISKSEKGPKSKVLKVAQYLIKKTNSSQKILKQIYKLHSHINDSTSAQNNKSDRVFNDSTTETIDNYAVALQKTTLTPKVTLLKNELYESKDTPTHKPEDKLSIMQGNKKEGSVPNWLISSASIFDSWTDSCIDETSEVSDGEEEDLMDIETYIPFNKTAFNIIFLSHPSMFPIAAAARILKLFLQGK